MVVIPYGVNMVTIIIHKISSELLPTLDIPKEGDIIQFGCGVAVTIEKFNYMK